MRRPVTAWTGAALLLLAVGVGAGELGLARRFGPDGLPFTPDDPLAPGGSAVGQRFMAAAGDACSEHTRDGAHQHGGSHPEPGSVLTDTGLSPAGGHTARTLADMVGPPSDPGRGLVLQAPFDWTIFVMGMNLDDAQMTRHRVFPSDDHWTDPATEANHGSRGWVTRGWTAEEQGMERVHQPGMPVKDLHVDALGLSYRDVKPEDGFSMGLHWETIDRFPPLNLDPEEPEGIKKHFKPEYGGRVDMLSQQSFVQGWVTELLDLNTHENGVSGNFVVDTAGGQPLGTMGFSEGRMGCNLVIRALPINLGYPSSPNFPYPATTTFEQLVVDMPRPEFGGLPQVDYLIQTAELEGFTCMLAKLIGIDPKQIALGIAREKARKRTRKLDEIVALFGPDLNDYANIGLYSGLAGREAKNPHDRLLLTLLEKSGQFKPTQWLKWIHVGADPVASLGFNGGRRSEMGAAIARELEPVVTESTQKVMTQATGWRYNFGNTYLAKSMMLFGASEGRRSVPYGQLVPVPERQGAPDILESVAKQWVHVRMDVIDPLLYPERGGLARWRNYDALIDHGNDDAANDAAVVVVDWPPPNFGFGGAQVSSFRAGSGGQITGRRQDRPDLAVATVLDPVSVTQLQGLVCVDPVTMTYSIAGGGFDDAGAIEFTPSRRPEMMDSMGALHFSWTQPRPLTELPPQLRNASGLRWLQASVNHHGEGHSEVRWMWDFERDDQIDSEHAQHMADVGASTAAGLFAYQSGGDGGLGRTGFRLVPVGDAAP